MSLLALDAHKRFLLKQYHDNDTLEAVSSQYLKMSGVYWGAAALSLLGDLSEMLDIDETVQEVMKCYDEHMGLFRSHPAHDCHLLYTCSAVQILALCGKLELLRPYVRDIKHAIAAFQDEDGFFRGDPSPTSTERDTRFSYCAAVTLRILSWVPQDDSEATPLSQSIPASEVFEGIDVKKACQALLQCSTMEGGWGVMPGGEGHAGQGFTALGALTALSSDASLASPTRLAAAVWEALDREGGEERLRDLERVFERSCRWLSLRQLPCGGLNGRPDKLEDVCYSWWCLSGVALLGSLESIDADKLAQFIVRCQDDKNGGISDRPEDMCDVYHTFFGLAGLSLLGYKQLNPIDPLYAIPVSVVTKYRGH